MSKKLEKARFIVYENCVMYWFTADTHFFHENIIKSCMYNNLKKTISKMIKTVKEENQINKDIIKLIHIAGNKMMENLVILYSKLFTYEELDKIYRDLLTEKGKKMFIKTNKLVIESFNIGSMFAEKAMNIIETN